MTDRLDQTLMTLRRAVEHRVYAKLRDSASPPPHHPPSGASSPDVTTSSRAISLRSFPEKPRGNLWGRLTQFARDQFLR